MGKVLDRLSRLNTLAKPKGKDERTIDIPEHLDWMFWRLVVEKVATLTELNSYYDLVEVYDAHTALDLLQEAEALAWKE
jgi:hypothetical protein